MLNLNLFKADEYLSNGYIYWRACPSQKKKIINDVSFIFIVRWDVVPINMLLTSLPQREK